MSTITAIISLFTRTPSRQQPATFSEDMDVRLSEENSRITQMNNMSSQMNTVAGEVNTSAQTATEKAQTATEKAQTATEKAQTATEKAAEALSYAQSALDSKNAAEAAAESINPDNLVYKTGDQTIAGVKTFSFSPIVPTPTTDMQVSTKKYVDDLVGSHIELSGATAYHLLQGNMSLSNTILTNGFSTTLYTGNGSTQSINTGVDMDTQWGNDASEKFGGLVWLKSRNVDASNRMVDTVRGSSKVVYTNLTNAEEDDSYVVSSFNDNGITLGSRYNASLVTYVSWNFQATHRTSGTTNHGKAYTCHYNPFTGFTIVKYEGSGIAGHEIPHHLGRKLGLFHTKNLSVATDWLSCWSGNNTMFLNLTNTNVTNTGIFSTETKATVNTSSVCNTSTNQYIMYGWANSYFDESNKLIGNYEIGIYQGTGVAGNKVTTRGKPAWIMIKRIDGTGNRWIIYDNLREFISTKRLSPNESATESNDLGTSISASDNSLLIGVDSAQINASGGQYLYMVVYDNDSASGKSKYPRATDTTQIQLNNAIVPLPNGIDTNGVKVSTVSKNETVTGVTLTQGKNYLRWEN